MAEYLKRENRRDKKWAHPQALGGINWIVPGLMDYFYQQAAMPPEQVTKERTESRRYMLEDYLANESDKKKAQGRWEFFTAPGCSEEPETTADAVVRIPIKDVAEDEKLPCIFDIQGGGLFAAGCAEFFMNPTAALSKHHRAVVVSPCYRLCTEAPFPAAVNDCHAAYQYMLDHAEAFHIDTNRIIIHGFSSGAQLALCMGFRLKRYGIKPRGIVASLPIVDDCNKTQSGTFSFKNPENGSIDAWDGEAINATMQLWLKGRVGSPLLPPEALPNRATVEDCIGFPPTWIPIIGEMDGSRDATLELLHKMHEANVFVDYHVWGGCNHNTTDPSTPLGGFMAQGDEYAIDQAIEFDFSRPWTEK